MDLGSVSLSVVMVCLLGAARGSVDNKNNCTCPQIPLEKDTEAPPVDCFSVNARYRYTCNEGKLRKAGTSSLIICKETNGILNWSQYNLECIDDPKIPRPPKTTVTAHTPNLLDIITTRTITTSCSENATTIQTTAKADHTTAVSTTTGASNSTNNPLKGNTDSIDEETKSSGTVVGITCISLVIICVSIGSSLYYCKRRRRDKENRPETPEEQVPMNVSP